MKQYSVTIKGTSPYMQHRMDDTKLEEWEKFHGELIDREDVPHSDAVEAEYRCYRTEGGSCYIPSEHIKGSLIKAGMLIKAKVGNATKTMTNIVAGQFRITPLQILLPDWHEVDKRSVVNQAVKARVISKRPKWNTWNVEFLLKVSNDTITVETIKKLIELAGSFIGIGSYRPTNKGEFGCFEIADFKEVK